MTFEEPQKPGLDHTPGDVSRAAHLLEDCAVNAMAHPDNPETAQYPSTAPLRDALTLLRNEPESYINAINAQMKADKQTAVDLPNLNLGSYNFSGQGRDVFLTAPYDGDKVLFQAGGTSKGDSIKDTAQLVEDSVVNMLAHPDNLETAQYPSSMPLVAELNNLTVESPATIAAINSQLAIDKTLAPDMPRINLGWYDAVDPRNGPIQDLQLFAQAGSKNVVGNSQYFFNDGTNHSRVVPGNAYIEDAQKGDDKR